MLDHIGKYKILDEIGGGGMGKVYKAYDPQVQREVAIKLILDRFIETPGLKDRFIREARIAGKLVHPNIAVVFDLAEWDDKPYIVMEFLDGPTLGETIKSRAEIPLTDKLDYARQICVGLKEAHDHGVIHRDVKPDNIHILKNGQIKIIDFGIAKPMTVDEDSGAGKPLTREGTRIGTPWYMSPEQIRGMEVDRRSDIFSFGVLFYELLTYRKPFEGEETTAVYKICNEEPDRIELEESYLVDSIQEILSKCLAKKPDDRFADCGEVLVAIGDVLSKSATEKRNMDILAEAYGLAENKEFAQAIERINDILREHPGHAEARAYLKSLQDREKESATNRILTGKIVGDVVSHYRIIEKLGGGGMGIVYKAEDILLRRQVALKFLLPELTRNEAAKMRFLQEARTASALDHPNICTVHEIDETGEGLLFICMALCRGKDLRKRMIEGPIPVPEAISLITDIARALGKAHEHGIVHRDVKPQNVIVDDDGTVKMVDFGLAKLSGGTRITKTGMTMGTLPYMSPEQVQGKELDARSDIWAVGVMLYELLTGELPFAQEYEAALLYSIVNDAPARPQTVNADVPDEIEAVIMKALEKDPSERYPSLQGMVEDLDRYTRREKEARRIEQRGAEKVDEVDTLVERGRALFGQQAYAEALPRFEAALRINPDNQTAAELRRECMLMIEQSNRIEELLAAARKYMEEREYKKVVASVESVIALDAENEEAHGLAKRARELYARERDLARKLSEAQSHFDQHNFRKALEVAREALDVDSGSEEARQLADAAETALREAERDPTTRAVEARPDLETEKPKRAAVREPVSRRRPVPRVALLGGTAIVAGVAIILAVVLGGSDGDSGAGADAAPARQPVQETQVATNLEPAGEDPLRAQADRARSGMTESQRAAQANDARTAVPDAWAAAEDARSSGTTAYDAGEYAAAAPFFARADSLYGVAGERAVTASRAEADAEARVGRLRTAAENAQREMASKKQAADAADAAEQAETVYGQALARERSGVANLTRGDAASLQTATDDFEAAARLFSRATDISIQATRRESDQRTEAQRVAAQKRTAESSRTAMMVAKDAVPGDGDDKTHNAVYQAALNTERDAEAQFRAGNFEKADELFTAARDAFYDAADEIEQEIARREAGPTAEEQIDALLAEYERYLESEDLVALTALMKMEASDRDQWADFFDVAEGISVSMEHGEIDTSGGRATVVLQVRIAYTDNKRRKQSISFSKTVEFAAADNTWRVVSSR